MLDKKDCFFYLALSDFHDCPLCIHLPVLINIWWPLIFWYIPIHQPPSFHAKAFHNFSNWKKKYNKELWDYGLQFLHSFPFNRLGFPHFLNAFKNLILIAVLFFQDFYFFRFLIFFRIFIFSRIFIFFQDFSKWPKNAIKIFLHPHSLFDKKKKKKKKKAQHLGFFY